MNRLLLIYFRRNLNAYPLIVVDGNEIDGILNLCEVPPTRTRYTNGICHFKWIGIIQFTIQSSGEIKESNNNVAATNMNLNSTFYVNKLEAFVRRV